MIRAAAIFSLLLAAPSAALASDAGATVPPGADVDGGAIVIPDHMVPQPNAPDVQAAVSQQTVPIGRPFSLFVIITYDPGVEVNLPTALPTGGAIDETRRTYTDRTQADGRKVREYEIQLMAWFAGDHAIPPLDVVYVVDGTAYETQTEPVPITVVGVIGEGEERLRDIAPPVAVDRPDYTLLWIAGIAGGVLILLVATVIVWRASRGRTRKVRQREATGPDLPAAPDARALARLEALEASGALDNDDKKPAYLELSEIVREYLGSRYAFAALDSTTSEIKERLAARPDGAPALEILGEWLADVDLVKYAGHQPSAEDAHQDLAQARNLVELCEHTPVRAAAPAAAPVPEPPPMSVPDASDTLRGMPAAGSGETSVDPDERWRPKPPPDAAPSGPEEEPDA